MRVISDRRGRKEISTGGGGGGVPEKGNKERKSGNRIARVGDWRVIILASDLRLPLFCARGRKLCASICGDLPSGRRPSAGCGEGGYTPDSCTRSAKGC